MKKNNSIWVLEDFDGCRFVYHKTLDHRYDTRYFTNLSDFREAMTEERVLPDLVIADITLEDGSLFDLLSDPDGKALMAVPFVVVSSMADQDALRFCYKSGAIDYMLKPFKKSELIVKVEQALLRGSMITGIKNVVELDSLTKKEKQILNVLQNSNGSPVSREMILKAIWKTSSVAPKTVDVHIHNLRRKIDGSELQIIAEGQNGWSLHKID